GPNSDTPSVDMSTQPFVFAHMDILREYLGYELQPEKPLPFPFDLERAVDDWVFLCFFVGNDFLPHLPSLEIREGAIEKLVEFWKEELPAAGGYITHDGDVDLFRIQPIMDKIGALEEGTFRERKRKEDARKRQAQQNRKNTSSVDEAEAADQMAAVVAANARRAREEVEIAQRKNFEAADKLRAKLAGMSAREKSPPSVDAGADEIIESGSVEVSGTAEKRTATEHDDGETDAMQVDDSEMAEPPAKQPRVEIKESEEKAEEGKEGEDSEMAEPPAKQPRLEIKESEEKADEGKEGDDSEMAEPPAKQPKVESKEPEEKADEGREGEDEKAAPSITAADDEDNDGSEVAGESSETPAPEEDAVIDNVKFHETGYKERYYTLKFGISADDREAVGKIVEHYVRGLCWVLQYYYQGCASWGWYYPYYYAPLASDFSDLDMVNAEMELGEPLRPFEQLMGVLPAASRKHLPEPFGELMTSEDSPIIDFYPTDFPLDMDGKKFLWQAVILLPFIDQERLLSAVQAVYPKLTPEENARNGRSPELLMVADANPLYESLCDLYAVSGGDTDTETMPVALNPRFSGRMSGTVIRDPTHVPHTACISPLQSVGRKDIEDDRSIGAIYQHPQPDVNHTAVLLPGVRLPRRALTSRDIELLRSGETARPPSRWSRNDNNRDFGHFYRQQGNDVSADRGYGPRRYDDRGNANPAYQRHYARGRGAGGRPPPFARPPPRGRHRSPPRQHPSHQLDRHYPFPKRPSAHPPTVVAAGRGARGGHRGGYRGGHRGGGGGGDHWVAPSSHSASNNGQHRGGGGGGYRGGYRGRSGY
ncbi:5'-3' exoribonuclease 2, partial [Coemansia guatemalensis]